mmetsp:Transcript_26133/g.82699  ORF Transcript_26133/g.82699 Transcript_26133/m.82699 type:complete len:96 (+) Transcript_26133:692-979(+)
MASAAAGGGGLGCCMQPPPLRRQILRAFKGLCHAVRDLPDPEAGRREIWRVKAWLRKDVANWDARSFAYLRYQQKEVEATIKLAKYRAMKRRYYD